MNIEKVLDRLFQVQVQEEFTKAYYFEMIFLTKIDQGIYDLFLDDEHFYIERNMIYDYANDCEITQSELLDKVFDIYNKIKSTTC